MAQSKHIDKVLDRHSDETIANNRLRLKTSINAIRWLAFQACAFRGDDESPRSLNRGNFIELIKLLASCNQNVHNVVLENAPGNAQYISPTRDESKREQMSVVLGFVDKHICVQERFFDLIHVSDTCSLTLKTEISSVLSHHNLDVQNLRGQGYDGELVICVVNGMDCKLYFCSRLNQTGTLQRAGDTRWSSHLNSVRRLLCMFDATCEVLEKSTEEVSGGLEGSKSGALNCERQYSDVKMVAEITGKDKTKTAW
ncbi:uncharacterized protein [Arachis hypogaea]|uniref:uncharacterized protein n=1 Tax=Arachis hypogaea TaxID=3818 RepID=UPI003B20E7E9